MQLLCFCYSILVQFSNQKLLILDKRISLLEAKFEFTLGTIVGSLQGYISDLEARLKREDNDRAKDD